MSTTAAIIIAVVAVVVLGAIGVHRRSARRSDVRGAGALSAETVRRDDGAGRSRRRRSRGDGRPYRRRCRGRRRRAPAPEPALVPVTDDTGLTPWTPPDPEALGVSRRQFFNRATISLMGASLGTFSAAAFVAFLWPTKTGGFGGKVNRRQADRHQGRHPSGNGFFYAPEARAWITELPRRGAPEGRGDVPAGAARRTCARASRSSTRSARTSAAASRSASRASGSSAAATVRSTTGSARRRAARPRAAWTTSRSRSPAAGDVIVDTGTVVARARRSAPTPPVKRPRVHTASELLNTDDRPHHHVDRVAPLRHHPGRLGRLRVPQHPPVARRTRLRDRARGQPQAVLRRRDTRRAAPDPRPRDRRRPARRHHDRVCRSTGSSNRPARPVRQDAKEEQFIEWGSRLFAPTADGGFNCAGCHGGMTGHGWRRRVQPDRPDDRRGPRRQLEGARAQHRPLPLRRGRGPVHPRLRSPVRADVALGRRRRRPDERPADRHADRLPAQHPDRSRGLCRR